MIIVRQNYVFFILFIPIVMTVFNMVLYYLQHTKGVLHDVIY